MLKYVFKRLIVLIPILLVVSFLVFWLMSMTGDPVATLMGPEASDESIEQMREELGLNRSIFVRYAEYMSNLLHGDFGKTMLGRSVWAEYSSRFPQTLRLALSSMIVTTLISIPLGIIAAVKQNTLIDTSLSALAMAGISMPAFWLGLMMVLLFSVFLGWLPATGSEGWKSVIMPAICLGVNNACVLTRMTRSSMVDVIRADYLRTARAKGCNEKTVILKHALKNALIPVVTIMGSQFSILLGGSSVVEQVFGYHGVGSYVVTSIKGSEYMAATGSIIMMTCLTSGILLLTDVLYAYVDPRIKARYTKK